MFSFITNPYDLRINKIIPNSKENIYNNIYRYHIENPKMNEIVNSIYHPVSVGGLLNPMRIAYFKETVSSLVSTFFGVNVSSVIHFNYDGYYIFYPYTKIGEDQEFPIYAHPKDITLFYNFDFRLLSNYVPLSNKTIILKILEDQRPARGWEKGDLIMVGYWMFYKYDDVMTPTQYEYWTTVTSLLNSYQTKYRIYPEYLKESAAALDINPVSQFVSRFEIEHEFRDDICFMKGNDKMSQEWINESIQLIMLNKWPLWKFEINANTPNLKNRYLEAAIKTFNYIHPNENEQSRIKLLSNGVLSVPVLNKKTIDIFQEKLEDFVI